MQRRDFFKTTGLAAVASGLSLPDCMAKKPPEHSPLLQKPARLREGATIALIAPCSSVPPERVEKALASLRGLGFQVLEGKYLRARNGYFAGTDEQRLADLHWAFAHPKTEAVWCARGGYGATRILADIDYDMIAQNPKPFIGYSDVTAYHLAILERTGLVTFHGQVGAGDFPEKTLHHLRAMLMDPVPRHEIAAPTEDIESLALELRPYVIAPGKVIGPLTGGNLSLLSAMAGTPFSPSYRGKIVFIEDIGEQPYRLDRMFTQMFQATDLTQAAGIALGVFADCKPKGDVPSFTLQETLRERLGGLGIPVVYGLPFGHVAQQATIPYGVRAELNASKMILTIVEEAVT